jgi:hypothetical protein
MVDPLNTPLSIFLLHDRSQTLCDIFISTKAVFLQFSKFFDPFITKNVLSEKPKCFPPFAFGGGVIVHAGKFGDEVLGVMG